MDNSFSQFECFQRQCRKCIENFWFDVLHLLTFFRASKALDVTGVFVSSSVLKRSAENVLKTFGLMLLHLDTLFRASKALDLTGVFVSSSVFKGSAENVLKTFGLMCCVSILFFVPQKHSM